MLVDNRSGFTIYTQLNNVTMTETNSAPDLAQLSDTGCFILQIFYFFFDGFGVVIKLICLHMVVKQ